MLGQVSRVKGWATKIKSIYNAEYFGHLIELVEKILLPPILKDDDCPHGRCTITRVLREKFGLEIVDGLNVKNTLFVYKGIT